jgi:magnesium chelatase family protein
VQPIAPAELTRVQPGEASAAVAARVAEARARQRARYRADGPTCNAEADGEVLRTTLQAEAEALALAEQAAARLRLSTRGFARTLRVARTLADLAGSATVKRLHVAEALTWRARGVREVA